MPGKKQEETTVQNNGQGLADTAIEQMARPEDLKSYEELAPGSAAKVLEVFWAHAEHRRELERRRASNAHRRDLLIMILAAIVALGTFGAGTWLVDANHQIPGTIFGVLAVLGAFLMFFILRRSRN